MTTSQSFPVSKDGFMRHSERKKEVVEEELADHSKTEMEFASTMRTAESRTRCKGLVQCHRSVTIASMQLQTVVLSTLAE